MELNVSESLLFVSSFAAAGAAIAAFLQARSSATASEATIYFSMFAAYRKKEMEEAIATLAQFWRDCRESESTVGEAYQALKQADMNRARALRSHARTLATYMINAEAIYSAGMIRKKLLRLLVYHPGLNPYFCSAVPILASDDPDNLAVSSSSRLKRKFPKFGSGMH